MGMSHYKGARTGPQRRKRTGIVEDIHVEAVFKIIITHEAEDIVVDIAEVVDLDYPLALKE
jgi:hypothetical protein